MIAEDPINLDYMVPVAFRDRSSIYMSPQAFTRVITNNRQIQVNASKNDVFALGMVLLHAAIGEHSYQCYDFYRKAFDTAVLQQSIKRMVDLH